MKLQFFLKRIGTGLVFLTLATSSSVLLETNKAEAHKISYCGFGATKGNVERFVYLKRKILGATVIFGIPHVISIHEVRVDRRSSFLHEWREDHVDKVSCTTLK
jgi:hypothetical protein